MAVSSFFFHITGRREKGQGAEGAVVHLNENPCREKIRQGRFFGDIYKQNLLER